MPAHLAPFTGDSVHAIFPLPATLLSMFPIKQEEIVKKRKLYKENKQGFFLSFFCDIINLWTLEHKKLKKKVHISLGKEVKTQELHAGFCQICHKLINSDLKV